MLLVTVVVGFFDYDYEHEYEKVETKCAKTG